MGILEKIFWIVVIVAAIVTIYLDLFVCGGIKGTFSDIPRWCWWVR